MSNRIFPFVIRNSTLRTSLIISAAAMLGACNISFTDDEAEATDAATQENTTDYGYETYSDDNLADSMASNDATPAGEGDMARREGGAANGDTGSG